MTSTYTTDVGDALAFAADHLLADVIDLGDDLILVRKRDDEGGETWESYDKRPESEGPRRPTGTTNVYDAASFLAAVERYTVDDDLPTVTRDEQANRLVAVLNDHNGRATGWRDHQVSLALRRTPEWQAWLDGQGLGSQVKFAERIEDGLPEIAVPDPATMLEIAQTFHAATSATFQSGNRLVDGRTQFAYLEDVKASAGTKPGTVEIPETFDLAVRPFIGAERYKVTARLRYRLKAGELTIGYTLVRPDEIERDAFTAVATEVQEGLPDATHLAGQA